ncbi:rhodanese-like domain-containing protein [Candidatus Bipolaricaulota bacterium]|nr:rhodanese-like domain-containing protein [Candidatus Bipolaricaulota bacterium]
MFKISTRMISVSVFIAVALMLVPALGMAAAQEDVIAAAADAYLNNPDTVFNISSEGLMEQLLGDNLPLVISLRPAESFALGHVTGAVNMPFGTLFESENLSALPNDNKIIVTCYTGHTASQATALLNLCGYDTTNLKWGIMGWTKDTTVATKQFANPDSDLPVETTANEATATYERLSVDVTSSSVESEIIKAACNAYASAGEKNIKAGDLLNLLMDGDDSNDPVIVSVRTAEQYAKGHIPGAINIPFKDIAKIENLEKLNPDKQIVVYCYTGRDASQATAILNTLGYDASNLLWGMTGWTTDPEIAPKRFDPAGIPDYPFEVGE